MAIEYQDLSLTGAEFVALLNSISGKLKIDQETQQPIQNNPLQYDEAIEEFTDKDLVDKQYVHSVITALNLGSIITKDFWQGSQDEYDALESYDDNTLYFIQEEVSS
jgi:hypothetical protein